ALYPARAIVRDDRGAGGFRTPPRACAMESRVPVAAESARCQTGRARERTGWVPVVLAHPAYPGARRAPGRGAGGLWSVLRRGGEEAVRGSDGAGRPSQNGRGKARQDLL